MTENLRDRTLMSHAASGVLQFNVDVFGAFLKTRFSGTGTTPGRRGISSCTTQNSRWTTPNVGGTAVAISDESRCSTLTYWPKSILTRSSLIGRCGLLLFSRLVKITLCPKCGSGLGAVKISCTCTANINNNSNLISMRFCCECFKKVKTRLVLNVRSGIATKMN